MLEYKPNFGGAAAILQAAANVIAVAERERLERLTAKPVAWIRQHPDGTLTGELLLDSQIEDVRKSSGAWVPLGRIAGVTAVAPVMPDHAVASVLCNVSQLLNAVEQDWKIAGHWSEWDAQTVQDFLAYKGRLIAEIERRTAGVKEVPRG